MWHEELNIGLALSSDKSFIYSKGFDAAEALLLHFINVGLWLRKLENCL